MKRVLLSAALTLSVGLPFAGCSDSSGGNGSVRLPTTPAAPAITTDEGASRLLTQSTFGPTSREIDSLRANGANAWFQAQVELPQSLHDVYELNLLLDQDLLAGLGNPTVVRGKVGVENLTNDDRNHNWWGVAVVGEDQLRQRMAFALSQILVISQADVNDPRGLANYYDMLASHAFGNYRELLEAVTLHPMMGTYLSMVRNEKADLANNIRPDENYAREIQQLFTIGLVMLNNRGEVQLDALLQPIPTYDQTMIEQFAMVFTGWNYAGLTSWNDNSTDWLRPMVPYESFHETATKTLHTNSASPAVIPAGQTARQDLEMALDNLFNHPNVGPFISQQLIQRLVTSNPSPEYIERVALVFNNDQFGQRGNLLSVLRAILFDVEAVTGPATLPNVFGKLKEPLLRKTQLWRAFNATGLNWRGSPYDTPEDDYGQGALRAPSVFNFYRPDYQQPGELATNNLNSPEFQILDTTRITETTNLFYTDVFNRYVGAPNNPGGVLIDISYEAALARQSPTALVNRLNRLLLSSQMPAAMRATIEAYLLTIPVTDGGFQRALEGIYLIVSSPQFSIQR